MDGGKSPYESKALAQVESATNVGHSDIDTMSLDERAIRKLRLKIDFIILPTLAIMYAFNSLDRSNLGNAKTAGLDKDTNLEGDKYNMLLTLSYVVFVVFGPDMSVFTKICTAKVSLPAMVLAFGIASACTAVAKDFGQLAACRIIVGMFESGFLASVVFYPSKWYTRAEIASRIAIFYAGAVVASGFGGLLAYAMFQVNPAGNLFVWSYLFILEGQTEKNIAQRRMQLESMQKHSDKFNWSEAIAEFKTVHGYARVLIGVSVGILPNASANFLAIMTAYPMSVIFSAWTVANIPNLNARAFTTAVLLACLNSMGPVASNIFFAREAPQYRTALVVNMAFAGIGMVFTVVYSLYLRYLNQKLDNKELPPIAGERLDGPIRFRFQT